MKKWLALPVVAAVLLLGWLIAGPYLTINQIRDAIRAQDSAALAGHVDFPALRANLKAQIEDRIARRAGPDVQSSAIGAFALRLAGGLAGGAVDAMVTPAGLGALMEGRNFRERLAGERRADDPYGERPPTDPLADAEYGFESLSSFTATVRNDDGEPVVFVLTRDGFDWRLSDIRLPPAED